MPVFFQQQINEGTRLGLWKIEETEEFFKNNVPQHRHVTHPRKRLQHLAGRFLLQFLAPDFPYHLIQIAETRKPFLPMEEYHFSISHCGDYAAAIVSKNQQVGIDVELVRPLVGEVVPRFLSEDEINLLPPSNFLEQATIMWSAKESVFKWYGEGGIDFRKHIQLQRLRPAESVIDCYFAKTKTALCVEYRYFDSLALAWVVS